MLVRLLVSGALLSLAASPARAQDWKGWFQKVYKSLTTSTSHNYASGTVMITAVAAVRGASMAQQDPSEPYWKGGVSEAAAEALKKQREEFAAAVQFALDGKAKEADEALAKFEKDHPKSALLPDAKEARAKLAEVPKAAAEPGETCDMPKAGEEPESCEVPAEPAANPTP